MQFVNTPTRPPLGADTWVHVEIMRHLDRATHELYAACATGPADNPTPTYQAVRDIPDIEIVPVDFGPELSGNTLGGRFKALLATVPAFASITRLGWHVRRRRIPIIHTSDRPRDALVCVLLAKVTRSTCIVHCHVSYSSWMSRMLRWSLHHADVLIAVSEFVGQSLVDAGIPPERVHVVLNAIDVDAWEPGRGRDATRVELGVAADAPVLVTVCRLFPEKGPGDIVRALPKVRAEFPEVRLLIAGTDVTGGAFLAELEALIAGLGLQDHVRLLGRRPDIEGLMAAADIYVMPSFDEPFGLVFAEAMAMRLPVVALDNGGTKEIVEHGRSGLLSDRGDLDALAEHIVTLLRNPELRATMGEYGRRRVEERFTTPRMAADAARVYASIA